MYYLTEPYIYMSVFALTVIIIFRWIIEEEKVSDVDGYILIPYFYFRMGKKLGASTFVMDS